MLGENQDFDVIRRHNNELILLLLTEYLRGEGRALRFNQLMYILNGAEDYFHEDPEETLARFRTKLNKTVEK